MSQDKLRHYQGVLSRSTPRVPLHPLGRKVIGTFLAGLKEGRILGMRSVSGGVLVPPPSSTR